MNEKYMICNDFLSSWNFSDLRILSLVLGFWKHTIYMVSPVKVFIEHKSKMFVFVNFFHLNVVHREGWMVSLRLFS